MKNNQVTKFLIFFVFVFLCSCDLFKSMCEAEKPPKQSTTLQQIVNDTNAGETIDLEKYSNEYDITDYNAEISKNLTIKNGSFQNTTLKIKAEVKLEKVQELSVETSANLTIRDSKLNNLLLGTNAESRSTNSGNTNFDLKVIVKNCEIAEKIKINSKAKLNIAGEKTKIAKIVVAVAAEVCKILCTTEVDTKKIENVITDENGEKPEEIKITQAYKITYHSNCDELEDIEDFFSPDDGTISLPTDIFKRNGYIFAGWYYDNNCTTPSETSVDVSDKTADIHVYAGWTKYIPGSGVYKYSINIEDIPESGPWNGSRTSPAFSILLLTEKLIDASIKHGDFYFSNDAYQIQTRASENLRITDTSKTGNYAVYGEVPTNIDSIPENDKYKYYSGVAATVTDTTLEIFVDMSKIVKTELKVFRKSESSTAQEEFVTENTLIDLTDYKPYIIALGTKGSLFTSLTWGADLMAMTGYATFPTNLQQSAPTTKNTNEVKELTATADDVGTVIAGLSAGTYTLKVTGAITNTTISQIATAMNNNTKAKINLDLSGTTGLTEIPENAFYIDNTLNDNLISIIIPDSVTSIGDYAFRNCEITSVTIGSGVTSIGSGAFTICSKLKEVIISNNIKIEEIKDYAFSNCYILTGFTIPSCLTSIGNGAFNYCSNLTKFEVDTSNPNYSSSDDGTILFNKNKTELIAYPSAKDNVTIPSGVTSIADRAFYHCSDLKNITIPDSVTTIGEYAFANCSSLTSIEIPDSVTSIGDNAFEWCSNLESITIPDSVTSIGIYAFYYCENLTSVTIPNSVTTIGDYAFSNCSRLTSIEIPNSVTTIGTYAFFNCSRLTSVTIGNGVTSIGASAFYYCDLRSIEIPNSVTTIDAEAFYYCEKLTSVTFADTNGWCYNDDSGNKITINVTDNTGENATYLKETYSGYSWYKESSTGGTAN